MRRWTGIVAILALVSAALVAGSGPAGAAPDPSVTATPSAALADGQTVTVQGTGFTDTPLGGVWRALQCDAGILTGAIVDRLIAHCDPASVARPAAADGTVSIPFAVHRSIAVGEEGRPVTCGRAPGDCALLIASGTATGFVGAATPISFANQHTVTVTPNKGLANGQTVTVTGKGFFENPIGGNWALTTCTREFLSGPFTIQRAVQVCAVGDPPFVFVPPTADGNITTPYTLHQEFSTLSGPVKCGRAPNDCVVLLAQLTSSDFQGGTAPISFGKPVPTLADCIREFLGDKVHHPLRRWFRLFVCIFTALTSKPR